MNKNTLRRWGAAVKTNFKIKEKLKKRFKDALFVFFNDQILKYIEYRHVKPPTPFHNISHEVVDPMFLETPEMVPVYCESIIDVNELRMDQNPLYRLESMLERDKQRFVKKILECVEVDSLDLFHHPYGRKSIRFYLYVGRPKHRVPWIEGPPPTNKELLHELLK